MTNESIAVIGEIADTCENLVAAASLRMPTEIKLSATLESLRDMQQRLRQVVIREAGEPAAAKE